MDKIKITELYAFIAKDEEGQEGLCAFEVGGLMMPMVAADFARVESLMKVAIEMVEHTGTQIAIYKFTNKEIHGVIKPPLNTT